MSRPNRRSAQPYQPGREQNLFPEALFGPLTQPERRRDSFPQFSHTSPPHSRALGMCSSLHRVARAWIEKTHHRGSALVVDY